MSYQDGMAAINLEMPERVPRTEYSACTHWELISRVTGSTVDQNSPEEERVRVQQKFMRAWNYGLWWNTCINHNELGRYYTDMGHANYEAGGTDFRQVGQSVFHDEEDVLHFDPMEALGEKDEDELVRRFNQNYRAAVPLPDDAVATTGTYITCMSGLIDLFGWDLLLLAAGVDPDGFGEVANRYAGWISQYHRALARSECPVVMVHDDIVWTEGAFLHPDWYRRYIFPNYKRMFAPLIEAGKKILYTSDGNYTEFIDDIAACGVNGFVMEPTTDMAYVAEKYGKTHAFVGNADTRILLTGTREEIEAEVRRCMEIGKRCPGFFMAVGNHIPANTPVENALWYNECYEKLSRR